jgi:hypothetical protein
MAAMKSLRALAHWQLYPTQLDVQSLLCEQVISAALALPSLLPLKGCQLTSKSIKASLTMLSEPGTASTEPMARRERMADFIVRALCSEAWGGWNPGIVLSAKKLFDFVVCPRNVVFRNMWGLTRANG